MDDFAVSTATALDGCGDCGLGLWPLLCGIFFCRRCRRMWTQRRGTMTKEIVRTGNPPSKTAAP